MVRLDANKRTPRLSKYTSSVAIKTHNSLKRGFNQTISVKIKKNVPTL